MKTLQHYEALTGKTQANGAVTFTAPTGKDTRIHDWQLKIDKGTSTTGTVAVTILTLAGTTYETLLDSVGAAVVFGVSSNASTYRFTADIQAVKLTPTSIDATYNAYLSGY